MSARSTSASSCASCWVRKRRGSGKTASLSWFCSFISCLHAERTPIASAEAKSRYPARNPSQDCEAEHVAGRAKNQLLPPRAAMDIEFVDSLINRGVMAFIAGDDDQSIYAFRYASPSGIQNFTNRFPQATTRTLEDC